MRLRNKILLPIAIFTSTLVMLFGYFFLSIRHIRSQIIQENENVQQIMELAWELSTLQEDIDYNMTLYRFNSEPFHVNNIVKNRDKVPEIIDQINGMVMTAQEHELLDIYRQNSHNILPLELELTTAINNRNASLANQLFDEWLNKQKTNSSILKSFTLNSMRLLQRNQQLIDEILRRLFFTGIGAASFSLLLILLLVVYLRRIITSPVKQLARAARSISQSKFDEAIITYHSSDELGLLADSIRHMSTKLQKSYQTLHKEVKTKTKELQMQQKLEKQKNDFIAIASHELRTPITSQKAFIQLLQRELIKNQDNNYLPMVEKISSQTLKLIKLITDLLDVSKMNIGKFEIIKSSFDYNVSVQKVVEEIQQMKSKHCIVIKGKVSRKVVADQTRIQQVLSNIILNAIKYSPDANKVVIKIKEEQNHIITSVQDFGIGIDKQYSGKIFERFYRVKNAKHSFSGMGIGLNISAEIIKLHQGKIWFKSEQGKGSTFYFTFPK